MLRRVLACGFAGLLILALALLAAIAFMLDTTGGLRLAARLAPRLSAHTVSIGHVSGSLFDTPELDDVCYTGSDGTTVVARRVKLAWTPVALLASRAQIASLDVDGLVVTTGPAVNPPPPAQPMRLPVRLPLDVSVGALTLTGFELRDSTGAVTFALPRADFVGSWIGDALSIDRLDTALPETGDVSLTAKLTMAAEHIDIAALHAQTREDAPAIVDAKGRCGFNDVASDLQLDWKDLRWPLVPEKDAPASLPSRVSAVNGSGHFTGRFDDYRFELSTHARTALVTAAPVTAKTVVARKKTNATVVKAGGNVATAPGTQTAPPPGDAHADAKTLATPKNAQVTTRPPVSTQSTAPAADTAKGTATPAGTMTSVKLIDAQLDARGSGGLHRVVLDAFELVAGPGSVSAKGTVTWSPAISADLDATIAKFDPAFIDPSLSGEINGHVVAKTTLRDSATPHVDFTATLDRSRLNGYPLTLDAKGEAVGETVRLASAVLTSGRTTLQAKGQVTPPFDIEARGSSADLTPLVPGLAGHASFTARLQGTMARPHLFTQGEAGALKSGSTTVAAVKWDADLDPEAPSKLLVTATDVQAGLKIARVQLSGEGLLTYQKLRLEANTERGDVMIAVAGGFDRKKQEWGGEISESKLSPTGYSPWSLEKPTGLLLGRTRLSLEPACWTGSGRACANLIRNVNGDGFRSEWNIDALQLEIFKPLLPKTLTVKGTLDGRGKLALVDGNIQSADGDLRLSNTRIEVRNAPTVVVQTGSVRAEQSPEGRLHAVLDFKLAQDAPATGTSPSAPTSSIAGGRADLGADLALAPGADFESRALSGSIKINVPDLAFVEPFVRELRHVGGHLDGDFRAAGTATAPKIDGHLDLVDGHARLVTPGIELKDVNVKLSGRGDGPLSVDGSAKSGDGTLTITGTVEPSTAPPTADLVLKADNFQAAAIPAARAWIGADLRLISDASGVKLTGELDVPKAEITPQGLGGGGVAPSSDQVIVGAEPPPEGKPTAITTNVRISLGDSVRLEGYGLKTRLEGAVTVFEEPGRETRGQGELRLVDGAYKAYGQDLKIDYGRLIFSGGAITEPAVELRAVRKPRDDIEVGVRVRGTLDRPELTLDSEPSMTREQQLSWLVLGRPLESTSTSDRSAVSNAALSLGLSGGDYLADKIGKKVGLDTISVGAQPGDDATAAQLTLGKYLTPRLFVSYGLGLFQPGNSFKMQYDIGHGFKLQSETGVVSGGDILYTVERK